MEPLVMPQHYCLEPAMATNNRGSQELCHCQFEPQASNDSVHITVNDSHIYCRFVPQNNSDSQLLLKILPTNRKWYVYII